MKRLLSLLTLLLVLAGASFGATSDTVLPAAFGGWQRTADQVSRDAATADATNAAVLREYGFADFEKATYARADRKIEVKLIRFKDASGAYGAFTFYKEPEMVTESIGDQGASANERIMFYRGNLLVDVRMDRITPMTAGELRELASMLPEATGAAKNLPIIPTYLPKQRYVRNSAHYVMGPVGLEHVGSPLPPDVVGFGQGAEAVLGRYTTSQGTATMMIISYPTPAIAAERQRAIEAIDQQAAANKDVSGAGDPAMAAPRFLKRTGPLLVLVTGQISESDAKTLLASVNYDADVTWNEKANFSLKDNVANLLFNEAVLIFIILGMAIAFGLVFAGMRLWVKKKFPGKIFDRPEDVEIIQLNLRR